jgi:phage terminase large subunit-like protein
VSTVAETVEWLRGVLAEGEAPVAEVAVAAQVQGISAATLRRASKRLGIERRHVGRPGEEGQGWVWALPVLDVTAEHAGALEVLGSLVLEDRRRWGEAAYPFQHDAAEAVLSLHPPRLHFLTRPRGASKTSDLAGMCVAALLEQLPARGRAFAFATDADQAALLLDALAGFAARTDGLGGALTIENYRVTAKHNGARLEVMAADAASAWGLKGDLFVVDEFAVWPTTAGPRRLWEAILSAVPKVDGCRLVLLSTAGAPDHPSAKLLAHARTSPEWFAQEVPGPCPWISDDALAEQRRLLPESQYRRLHLNEWVSSEDRLVSAEDLAACATLDGPQAPAVGTRYVMSLDMAYVHDQAVLAVCHRDGERVVLDRMHAWKGSRLRPVREHDVEATLLEAHRAYNRPEALLDPWQTKGMAQRLRGEGVNVTEFTFSAQSVGRIALVLYRLLRDHQVALDDDGDLLTELARVQLRETAPGVYRMDHAHGEHDDRAVALAMCCAYLVEQPTDSGYGSSIDVGPIPRPTQGPTSDVDAGLVELGSDSWRWQ